MFFWITIKIQLQLIQAAASKTQADLIRKWQMSKFSFATQSTLEFCWYYTLRATVVEVSWWKPSMLMRREQDLTSWPKAASGHISAYLEPWTVPQIEGDDKRKSCSYTGVVNTPTTSVLALIRQLQRKLKCGTFLSAFVRIKSREAGNGLRSCC